MSPTNQLQPWQVFAAGVFIALSMQVAVAVNNGGVAALIRVGEDYPARAFIEEELGEIPLFPSDGHDGQASYVVARQPFGGDATPLLDVPAHRYLRWLYPALSGGFGVLPPLATVFGLAIWAAIGFGLAGLALAFIRDWDKELPRFIVLGVFLNVGLWLSVILSTPDALGLGLSLMAVATYKRRSHWMTVALLVSAVITKEQFLVFAIALGLDAWLAGDRWQGIRYAVVPGLGLGAVLLAARTLPVGSGIPAANLAWPFAGFHEAFSDLLTTSLTNRFFVVLTLVGVFGALAVALWSRDRLMILLAVGWMAVAALAGPAIWVLGNNALRVLAAVWPLMTLAAGIAVANANRVQLGSQAS